MNEAKPRGRDYCGADFGLAGFGLTGFGVASVRSACAMAALDTGPPPDAAIVVLYEDIDPEEIERPVSALTAAGAPFVAFGLVGVGSDGVGMTVVPLRAMLAELADNAMQKPDATANPVRDVDVIFVS